MEDRFPEWLRKTFPWLFMLVLTISLLDQGFEFFSDDKKWLALALGPLTGALMLLFPSRAEVSPRRTGLDAAAMSLVWLAASSVVARRAMDFELFGWAAGAVFAILLGGLLRHYLSDEPNPPAGAAWIAVVVGLVLLVVMVFLVAGPGAILPLLLNGGLLFFASGYLWSLALYPAGEVDWPVRMVISFALCLGAQPVVFIYLNRLGMPISPTSIVTVVSVLCLGALATLRWQRTRHKPAA